MVGGQTYKIEIHYSNADITNPKYGTLFWSDNAFYNGPETVVVPFKYLISKKWNDMYLIFNDSTIQESSGSPRWSTVRIVNEIAEVRKPFRSQPLWTIDLSNLQLTPAQYEELLAFQWQIEGMLNPFLIRNVRNCRFESFDGRGQLLGMGDGIQSTFQLKKTRPIQGRTSSEIIRYPNWDYPPLRDWNGNVWAVSPEVQLYVGGDGTGQNKGDMVPRAAMTVDRNTGFVTIPTPDEDAPIWAYGGFFTLVVANEDEIPVKPVRNLFRVDKGVTFSEPIGGGGE